MICIFLFENFNYIFYLGGGSGGLNNKHFMKYGKCLGFFIVNLKVDCLFGSCLQSTIFRGLMVPF